MRTLPAGHFVDNAALEFSPDGSKLAFAGHRSAMIWDVRSGKELASWTFPAGLQDKLAFRDGRLFSFRVETKSGLEGPFRGFNPHDYPRVCHIRDLSEAQPKLVATLTEFNVHVYKCGIAAEGRFYLVDGESGTLAHHRRLVSAFDGRTGKKLWEKVSQYTPDNGAFADPDPEGRFVDLNLNTLPPWFKLDLPSGKVIGTLPNGPEAFPPLHVYRLEPSTKQYQAFTLHRRQDGKTLLTLGIDRGSESAGGIAFNSAETHVAWGNADGTVSVCNIQEVQHRLSEVGLGW
jgi:hypothetical protein